MTDRQFSMLLTRMERIEKMISGESTPELLNSEETAKFLGIAPRTLFNRMQEPGFPTPIRVGRFNRFRKQDLASWVNNQVSQP